MRFRAAVSELLERGRDREWLRKRFLSRVAGRYFDLRPPANRSRIVDRDWDTLLLLDACRYDLFETVNEASPLPGDLSMRRSMASGTPDYLQANFAGDTHHDIVYVTANPYVDTKLPPETFHATVSVWRDAWDDDLGTVLPEAVASAVRDARERYPNKRVIAHFNQPHTPFVGDERIEGRGMQNLKVRAMGGEARQRTERTPFEALGAGDIDRETVWRAYRSNLERVWPAVRDLLETAEGRTVVTSDHGNALGERAWPFPVRVYGHPLGVLIPALVEVPWLVLERGTRPTIRAAPPKERAKAGEETVDGTATRDRLRDLGYVE